MTFDWQLVAVVACVAWAAVVVVRRATRLFRGEPLKGCGTGGCSACPSNAPGVPATSKEGFVPLESLVQSSRAANESKQE